MTIFFDEYRNTGFGDTPVSYGGEEIGLFEAMGLAYESQVRGSNIDTFVELMREELQPVIDTISERQDIKFLNPGDFFGATDSLGGSERAREYRLNEIFNHLENNRELYPEFMDLTRQSLEETIKTKALEAIDMGREARARENTLGTIGGFIGQAGGIFDDRAFLELMTMTGPAAFARTGPQTLGRRMLGEAMIGAGVEAVLQPGVKEWYDTLGIDYSYSDMLANIAAGGIIGAALPPVIDGGVAGVKMTSQQVSRGLDAFRGNGIKPKDADIIQDRLEDFDELNNAPSEINVTAPQDEFMNLIKKYNEEETFLPDSPEFVRPVRADIEILELDSQISALKSNQPFETVDELYDIAPLVQAKLENAGRRIEAELGVEFKNPGIKNKENSVAKISRKGYSSPKQLTDIVRVGFVAKTGKQSDEIVAALKKEFNLVDEGWGITPNGYFDRKILIQSEDGLIGEVQIWPPNILKAKKEGHKLYKLSRATKNETQIKKLRKKQIKLYTDALFKEHQSYRNLFGILNDPNLVEKIALKDASPPDITRADVNTSPASTGTQSPPGSSMASAFNPSESTIAGRPSQDVNTTSDIASPSRSSISDAELNVTQFERSLNKADKAFENLRLGNLPDDIVDEPQRRSVPQETRIKEQDVEDFSEQVSRDTDFENIADDETFQFDEIIDDQVVSRTYTGAQVKAELAQDQQMLDRLRGCVV